MANLSVAIRTQIWRGSMRYWSDLPADDVDKPINATKFELYNPSNNTGMIADIDAWIDTHTGNTTDDNVGLNGAINASYRTKFSVGQKGFIVMAVAAARTGNLDILKRAIGKEVE